jgi:hypothetical protein
MRYTSPSRVAVVRRLCRSLPASVSDRQRAPRTSPCASTGKKALLLFRRTEGLQDVAEHQVRGEDSRQAEPRAGQFLEHRGERGVAGIGSPVLFGDIQPEQPSRPIVATSASG